MFEYTALVDAPVQRFTSIVTGPDPDLEPVAEFVAAPPMPIGISVPEAPVVILAVAAEPIAAESIGPGPIVPEPIVVEPLPLRRFVPARLPMTPRREPTPTPKLSFKPALIAVAAAGLTAMWWLRREPHDRGR